MILGTLLNPLPTWYAFFSSKKWFFSANSTQNKEKLISRIAKKEADIRVTEARGIAEAQNIIDKTLTPEYLQYLAIQSINPDADVIYMQMDGILPITEANRLLK